ncbi:Txe/YoeB family addiction module toxin [Elioraea tepidiphila]|uniref:Txe/YoeB family addiction module toxin n=1 Tax=Elioraea tepidiphila TaxID=457934 RepID=UPI00036952E3|nr:Txe/YoeB family addiction module toxin [Elioraea tepidiphila]
MLVAWTEDAWDEYVAWPVTDREMLRRINRLIEAIRRDPFRGEGKPEPLRNALSGWWSRRITVEHRLVYRVTGKGADQVLTIAQCRLHY